MAHGRKNHNSMVKDSNLQDPRYQYEKTEIPKQHQAEPGLDSEMKPLADHGDDTYVGKGRLKGRKVLITGGDSGIGRAVAIACAREGADVAVNYLPEEQADADYVLLQIRQAGQKAVAVPGDLADEEFCRSMVNAAAAELGGLDVVINNAGKQIYNEDFATLPAKQIKDTFAVNIMAMFWITQESLKYLKPGASIINTSSIQATQPSPDLIDYATTKAAITNFTRALSQQLTPKGIRVNAIAPGPIWTPLQPSEGQSQKKLVEFGNDTPLGRPGQPAELAAAYVYLASDESSYVSGETIGVTGGKLR